MPYTKGTCKYSPVKLSILFSPVLDYPEADVHSLGDTGEQIRDHKFACSAINLHGTTDCVFDDERLDELERFTRSRSVAIRDQIVAEKDWADGPGVSRFGQTVASKGSLTGYLIVRYGTEDPALDERDWELVDEWFQKGRPVGMHVDR